MTRAMPEQPQSTTYTPGPVAFFAALAVVAIAVALAIARSTPPDPLPADAPAHRFSAGRAGAELATLLAEDQPHPLGTAANARVRERIVAALRARGYRPELQRGYACGAPNDGCGPVVNVVATLPGRAPLPAVVLATHYDSVGAGPGAGDAGASVAAMLEIARILAAGPRLLRPVIFLFDEGEEVGLLGAQVFADAYPPDQVLAVINLEARGTSGPSALFETSRKNGWLIRAFADRAQRPVTNSALYALYMLLSNDTDLTVFKRRGHAGLNFAFAGDLPRYHTPLDDIEHLDAGSLQHQGDSALAAAEALAGLESPPAQPRDVIFFDVMATTVAWWPRAWTAPLAGIAAALLAALACLLVRRGVVRGAAIAWGALAWLAMVIAPVAIGVAVTALLQAARGQPSPWTAHPAAALVMLVASALATAFAVAALLQRRAGLWGMYIGGWLCWAGLAVVAGLALPGVSYLLIVPVIVSVIMTALVAALVAAPAGLGSGPGFAAMAVMLPALVAAVLWASIGYALWIMIGLALSPAVTLPVALVATAVAPLMFRRRRWLVPAAGGVVATVAFVAALVVPAFSAERPQRVNLWHIQDADRDRAWWRVRAWSGPAPAALDPRGPFALARVADLPLFKTAPPYRVTDAPVREAAPPELDVIDTGTVAGGDAGPVAGGRRLRLRLRSRRGATTARLHLPAAAGLVRASVQGRRVPFKPARPMIEVRGLDAQGVDIELVLAASEPIEAIVLDQTYGLPAQGAHLLQARPSWAVPTHDGDAAIVFRRVRL